MNNIRAVMQVCIRCLNVRLTFAPYSFTILDFIISLSIIGIGLAFMMHLLKE